MKSSSTLLRAARVALTGVLALFVFAAVLPARDRDDDGDRSRGSRRGARLSRHLQRILDNGQRNPVRVLYQGPRSEANRLSQFYGVRVVKWIQSGAVLEGSTEQILSVSQDGNVPSLQEDTSVFAMMAVTTQTTGADQVWGRRQEERRR